MLLANFNRKVHLRHRAVSLRQHGFLVNYLFAAVTITTFLISGFLIYLGLLYQVTTVPSYLMSGKNRLSKSGKTIRSGGIFAGAGFLPDLEKCRIPAGAGAEIRYSPTH